MTDTVLLSRMVTFEDLERKLGPLLDRRTARHDLHDLWKMGAPDPQSRPGKPERRVLLPTQFQAWWQEMAKRQMSDLTYEWE